MCSKENSRIPLLRPEIITMTLGTAEEDGLRHGSEEETRKRRFLGVRQRPSGRWVAEIKDSSHQNKLRLWLGTFDRAEEAATAYDSAARLLRGRNAKTNFVHHPGITVSRDEENCSLLDKNNPRLYRLLKHAVMKNIAATSSSHHHHSTMMNKAPCNIGSVDATNSSSNKQQQQRCFSSKVYSSVIVAPSFSASLNQGGGGGPPAATAAAAAAVAGGGGGGNTRLGTQSLD